MQLLELFESINLTEDAKEYSPIGAPSEDGESDIDWLSDLKFYIDNDDKLLNNHFFPSIKKHHKFLGNENIYKIYMKPVLTSLDEYCDHYDIEDRDEKFPSSLIKELARKIASEQEEHINNGEYADCVNMEDAAGVGIITKQNTTKDVGPGTIRKNLKAFKLV